MKKSKIIACVITAAVLIFAFWYGGNSPGLHGFDITTENTAKTTAAPIEAETKKTVEPHETSAEAEESPTVSEEAEKIVEQTAPTKTNREKINTDKYMTEPVPIGMPEPVEPQNAAETDKENMCTLSVRCDSILNNMSWLKSEKHGLIPKDGTILSEREVVFYDGESVFNLLVREMKKNKIHMEFVNTPVYNSAYIEGIANIYEFDCGELSGWMYSVNGWFPNYGCSRYMLKNGDKVEWVYTCDLGNDVGGEYSAKNGG